MNTKTIIEITNPHETARLLSLIKDGLQVLGKQGRKQRGIDGYTVSDLLNWHETLSKSTSERCQFANTNNDLNLIV